MKDENLAIVLAILATQAIHHLADSAFIRFSHWTRNHYAPISQYVDIAVSTRLPVSAGPQSWIPCAHSQPPKIDGPHQTAQSALPAPVALVWKSADRMRQHTCLVWLTMFVSHLGTVIGWISSSEVVFWDGCQQHFLLVWELFGRFVVR
jgi:hypothetical protein